MLLALIIVSAVEHVRREAVLRQDLLILQSALPIGMTRVKVNSFLESTKTAYDLVRLGENEGTTYEINIGSERPYAFICKPQSVYVALQFSAKDVLKEVHFRRSGRCL